ncbi:MAG: BtaA family protein, partial [Deltaproteobacteria bacterium]|nr:BtaA family protein [Deltaproteobacteria bacterium]
MRSPKYPAIRYAQCWEDPVSLRRALRVSQTDDIVSIASGGENSFALLLDGPRSLTAVDSNAAQLFLVELKMRALKRLDYDDFAGFIGARPCQTRERLYRAVRPELSPEAREYWDNRTVKIDQGIIHCGKFENYFSIFRRVVLPLVHTSTRVRQLLTASSVAEQRAYYHRVWNNHRWRALFRVFFGKWLMGSLGRDPSVFQYVRIDDIAEELLHRASRGVAEVPLRDNYFIEYILTGRFKDLERSHPYL